MSGEYNSEQNTEDYDYGRVGNGKTVLLILLAVLLVAAAVAAVSMGKQWSAEQAKTLSLQQQMEAVTKRMSEVEGRNAELSGLLADKQAENDRIKDEWSTQVETLKQQHKDQLQSTYTQMNDIVYNSRTTLSYIGDIENRLKSGKELDEAEAAKLQSVVNGLLLLHEQYKKPLNEFRELSRYFGQQLAALPEGALDPKETTPLGKRIFKNREFQNERKQFFESQGRRIALIEAQDIYTTAYSNAQDEMNSISLDVNEYLTELDSVIQSNQKSAAELTSFFEKSREILQIHEKIMNIEPAKIEEVRP
mgnify:FL=1